MKIAVSSQGNDLDAPFSPVFGRCPVYILVDTDTMAFQPLPNQAMSAASGAGIQAAQEVARQGVGAIVTGNVGPNAYQVLAAAGVGVYTFSSACTVRQAVEAFKSGKLTPVSTATVESHAGMGMMGGPGAGRGPGGQGRSGGGRGMGGGRGNRF